MPNNYCTTIAATMPRFPSKPVTGTDLTTGQVTHYPSMYAATKAIAARRGKRAASMLPGLSHVLDKPDRSAHGCRWTTTLAGADVI